MSTPVNQFVRPLEQSDYEAWFPLWMGYNAFYGRQGVTALSGEITTQTWNRFFDPSERVFALVAIKNNELVGLVHYIYHPSTSRLGLTCYIHDIFTLETERGHGIGGALIQAVYEVAKSAGVNRVYWQTHETNAAGRLLYDKVAKHSGFIVYSQNL